ncbi:VPLPA-CTERM protein sorting domain-containing protein [Lutimaribacter pacificus]|uniref:VPLPA-CTERM protein sorting domain-containing protein n=1 Tax=Lutimaribacter pacificus TaxID=391948 RepID=A0A1H0EZ44_9RHOB|nr:choice-of-anchor K domain-containing protein [Lutimaribacter pacificus]SDN87687.1 VPLPA-CTERM protein sorting domain-containing protein [Lutimaribacter pacificus]SHK42816.1 VPLPA-CTERM protein sorting domain-containing protein [Lutimaribacter pacificus]
MELGKLLLAGLFTAAMATGASAATLSGSSSGEFTNENGGYTCTSSFLFWCTGGVDGASGLGTSTLEWPGETDGHNHSNPARSSLTINDESFSHNVPSGAGQYLVGSLTWYNASSPEDITPDEFTAKAVIDLMLSSPSAHTGSEEVKFTIENTTNPTGDEIFAVALGGFDFGWTLPLDLGEGLTLDGFSASLVGGSDGTFAGGLWFNPENGTSTLGIYANVTAAAAVVPLPAGGLLLLTGLGGMAALRRRKKAA